MQLFEAGALALIVTEKAPLIQIITFAPGRKIQNKIHKIMQ